jgi:integrase
MALRVIYREAIERELVQVNIAATIKTPKIQVKAQKFLTWEKLSVIDFGFQTDRIQFLVLHGLRYGEAAALTSAGIHVTTAAKLMGHSNPMMTLKIYTPVRDDEAGLAGIKLAKYIAS